MIEVQYNVTFDRTVLNLENRVLGSQRQSMQTVVETLTTNIKNKFTDQNLADTITGVVDGSGHGLGADVYAITGRVTSTWPDMIYFEQGRPAGKMPPTAKIAGWAVRRGIQPDPAKVQLAFAYAINASRLKRDKHALPLDVLVDWQNKNGITPSPEFAMHSMAYAIALKIARDGVPGHHYFEQGLNETRPLIQQTFESAVISSTGF